MWAVADASEEEKKLQLSLHAIGSIMAMITYLDNLYNVEYFMLRMGKNDHECIYSFIYILK